MFLLKFTSNPLQTALNRPLMGSHMYIQCKSTFSSLREKKNSFVVFCTLKIKNKSLSKIKREMTWTSETFMLCSHVCFLFKHMNRGRKNSEKFNFETKILHCYFSCVKCTQNCTNSPDVTYTYRTICNFSYIFYLWNLSQCLKRESHKTDSHIACRVHAAPMPFPCHAVPLRV